MSSNPIVGPRINELWPGARIQITSKDWTCAECNLNQPSGSVLVWFLNDEPWCLDCAWKHHNQPNTLAQPIFGGSLGFKSPEPSPTIPPPPRTLLERAKAAWKAFKGS